MGSPDSFLKDAEKCVFCAKFDNEPNGNDIVSFEPLNPVTPGHLLFVHRLHTTDFSHAPSLTAKVMSAASQYAQGLEAANIITSKGEAATQSVFHLHIHVIPRQKDDKLCLPWTHQAAIEELISELEKRVGFLRQALNEDRITDTSKLVTNIYIESWLGLAEMRKKAGL